MKELIKKIETWFEKKPFSSFPCVCGQQVIIFDSLMPGQAWVENCNNCKTSWTVYNPSLVIRQTKELPEDLQKVWAELSG